MVPKRVLIRAGGRWGVVLWLVLLLVPVSGGLRPSWAQTEGDLRLSNGTTQYEGRVEIYSVFS